MSDSLALIRKYGDARAGKALHNGEAQRISCDLALSAAQDAIEAARAAGYAAGVKDEREAAAKAVIENRSCKVMHSFQPSQCEACYWFDNIAAAIRARSDASLSPRKRGSDAQEVKP